MSGSTFKTNPVALKELLADCEKGKLQLPDFQRGWVWDEDRIIGLIASIARAFPVGALMTLESGAGVGKEFAHRPIEGTPESAATRTPNQLLLDGQQRMTSLYQACLSKRPVKTTTAKNNKAIERHFYFVIRKALAAPDDLADAILPVPADRCVRTNFNRDVTLDLRSPELEYEQLMYPVDQVLDWDAWSDGFRDYWKARGQHDMADTFKTFKDSVLKNFVEYLIPVIALGEDTTTEAVCLVFEKVNTGGKVLDAFELLTAMYAAHNFRLRDEWLGCAGADHKFVPGLQHTLATYGRAADRKEGVLAHVSATDFLQAITLLHSKEQRLAAEQANPDNPEKWPAVRATRQTLLRLPLAAYQKYRDPVLQGFQQIAKFLRRLGIYRVFDLPYQAQLIPLAAIFADLGNRADPAPVQDKLARWYWCGVFGELYGAATESRYAKDVMQVPAWIEGGTEPDTVRDGVLNPDRLLRLYSRSSAAYKGINALLMGHGAHGSAAEAVGARDFRTGQAYDATVFFDENVDIHHIFPQAWCKREEKPEAVWNSVVNKTPISYRTNRIIGGDAPSGYLAKLEAGDKKKRYPPIPHDDLDGFLKTHAVPVMELRADDFEGFIRARQRNLMQLICDATGQPVPAELPASSQAVEPVLDEFAASLDVDDEHIHGASAEEVL